jgi:putative transposase
VKYACIQSHLGKFRLRLMCRVLGVSVSGFYAWRKRGPSERSKKDRALLLEIDRCHKASRRIYGSPRVFRSLREELGLAVGEKRVARLMREAGLRAKTARRFKATTDSGHVFPIAPNVLRRRFSPDFAGAPNRVWTSDITYIPTREGWLYLSVVLDLSSRRVVGWSMQNTAGSSLAIEAIKMALSHRRPESGMLHHSDRGIQYAARDFRRLLKARRIECSMSRTGDCWDNAVTESFFATLKKELVQHSAWRTRQEARAALFEWIEVWYNRQRRHSSIGFLSPTEYEMRLLKKAA